MNDMWSDVFEFHRQACLPIGVRPGLVEDAHVILARNLIREEFFELLHAFDTCDINKIAQECVDLIYVVLGASIICGIDLRPVWSAIHYANLQKISGPKREDGKQLKPDGWVPANVKEILEQQKPLRSIGE